MLAFLLLALLYMWLNTTTQGKKDNVFTERLQCTKQLLQSQ